MRLPRLLAWLELNPVDAKALQETMLTDDKFPQAEFAAAGWQARWLGQKTYNVVALISRVATADVVPNIPGFDDAEARVIAGTVDGVRVTGAHFPNVQAPDSDDYDPVGRAGQIHCTPEEPGRRNLVVTRHPSY